MNKLGTSWWLKGKESTYHAGDPGSIPGLQRSPGEGNDYPLHDSCLENSMDRGAWQAPWGCKESDTTERLSLYFTLALKQCVVKSENYVAI